MPFFPFWNLRRFVLRRGTRFACFWSRHSNLWAHCSLLRRVPPELRDEQFFVGSAHLGTAHVGVPQHSSSNSGCVRGNFSGQIKGLRRILLLVHLVYVHADDRHSVLPVPHPWSIRVNDARLARCTCTDRSSHQVEIATEAHLVCPAADGQAW